MPDGGVYKIQCKYFVGSDLDCFIATIKANIRNEPKHEDNAHNIGILLHNFKLSVEDIAGRVYGRFMLDGKPDVRWVKDHLALEDLAPEVMAIFKSGEMKASAAIALASLAQDIQRQRVADIQASGKKLTAANVKRDTSGPAQVFTPPAKFGRTEACAIVQEFLDSDWSGTVAMDMTPENLIITVLGDVLKKWRGSDGSRHSSCPWPWHCN